MKTRTGHIEHEAARGTYRAYFTTPMGAHIRKRFKTKQEATDWLAAQVAAVAGASFVEPSKLTVGAWLLLWLKHYKQQSISQRSFEFYIGLAKRCTPISEIRIQQLTAPQVQAFYSDLLTRLSARSVKATHTMLNAAFTKAVNLGLLARNVIDLCDPPRVVRESEIITFTKDEIQKIYAAAREYVGGRFYPLILLAATTGARLGELQALEWSDIDFKTGEIIINKSLAPSLQLGDIIKEPKTRAGVRKLTVPPGVINDLKPYRMVSKYVFTTRTGTPVSRRNIERAYKQIILLADVPYRNFHVFRHTHATDLLAAGVPVIEVARRLGHARVAHTLEIYGHAIPSHDKMVSEKVAEIYL